MEQTWNKWVFYLKKMRESSPLRQGIEQAGAIISHRDISGTLLNSILKYETRLEGRLQRDIRLHTKAGGGVRVQQVHDSAPNSGRNKREGLVLSRDVCAAIRGCGFSCWHQLTMVRRDRAILCTHRTTRLTFTRGRCRGVQLVFVPATII